MGRLVTITNPIHPLGGQRLRVRHADLSYSNRHADLLFEVVSRRYGARSTLVTTNKPFAEWSVSIVSPLRLRNRQDLGVVAGGRLTLRKRLTALHFRSRPRRTYGFLQTHPRGYALASSVLDSP
jgi:hypothetical protein